MERRLNETPALVYVKDLRIWVVVNHKSELIAWSSDPAEVAWLSTWVTNYAASEKAKLVVNKPKPKAIVQRPRRISPRANVRSTGFVLPVK